MVVKTIVTVVLDVFLVSNLAISAKLGVNGIAYNNIVINYTVFTIYLLILRFKSKKLYFRTKLLTRKEF